MKKLVCILLSLAMLCSLVVVNVSAANVYEGEGFELVLDYDCEFIVEQEDDSYYCYICVFEGSGSKIVVEIAELALVFKDEGIDDAEECYMLCKNNEDFQEEIDKEILIDGVPAFIEFENFEEDCCFAAIISDNYLYNVKMVAKGDIRSEELLDVVVDSFHITDSTSWYSGGDTGADNKNDADKSDKTEKTDKDSKEEKTDEKTSNDNTTIIIVAIVCGTVLILGMTAIVVFGKKKKQ